MSILTQINFIKDAAKNKKGFGIIEIIIATGLMTVILAGLMTMLTDTNKSLRSIQAKNQQLETMSEIRNLLANNVACNNSFSLGDPTSGFTVTTLKTSANVNIYDAGAGATDKSGLLQYNGYTIAGYLPPPISTAIVTVSLLKTGSFIGVKEIKERVTIKVALNASNQIIDCFSLGTVADSLWKSQPSTTNIYYNGGLVGIGTNTPQAALDVTGNIQQSNPSGVPLVATPCSTVGSTIAASPNDGGQNLICISNSPAPGNSWSVVTSGAAHGSYRRICRTQQSGMYLWSDMTTTCAPAACDVGDTTLTANQCSITSAAYLVNQWPSANLTSSLYYKITCEIWCLH